MNRQFAIDTVTDARAIADHAEQVAHELRRTLRAVEAIVGDVKVAYKTVVAPFVELLTRAGPPAKVQLLASTEMVR